MNLLEKLEAHSARLWAERRDLLGEQGEKADSISEGASEGERLLLQYYFATLPLSDLTDYDWELFQKTAQSACRAREDFPWCAALPEDLFLLHTAYPRINNEELADCRELFRSQLEPRVRGLTLPEAILEVNRWCAEQVTYRSTDDRTSSALSVYRRGYGRCGEESVFAVTALRSVGIAARQVYAPWWSHCDDNHAWVEAWDGESWRYLGACEPEPELDRGWFTSAAARAMMIHTRIFAPDEPEMLSLLLPEADPRDLWIEHGTVCEAVTHRYGDVVPLTVTVQSADGKPVSGARVGCSVLNMAGFSEITARKTGQDGTVQLRLGKGGVLLYAFSDGNYGEALGDLEKSTAFEIVLQSEDGCRADPEWTEFDFRAPEGLDTAPAPLSEEQKQVRREWLDCASSLREKKQALWEASAKRELSPEEARALSTLTEKDRDGETGEDVLRDCLGAFEYGEDVPSEMFAAALLCPRVGWEPLRPWREAVLRTLSQEERECFREEPGRIWDWIGERFRGADGYPALFQSVSGMLRSGLATETGRRTLFCALCRSLGVPARLSPLDGAPEYWKTDAFLRPERYEPARLVLVSEGQEAGSKRNYTVSRLEERGWQVLNAPDVPSGGRAEMALSPGRYRIVTVSRMPGGGQLARQRDIFLSAGSCETLKLAFRRGRAMDLLTRRPLPSFTLKSPAGQLVESSRLLERTAYSLLVWLEVNREPTEHILNELCSAASALGGLCRERRLSIHCIVGAREEAEDRNLTRYLALQKEADPWEGDLRDDAPLLARQMFEDPEKLPLVLLTDCKGNGLYSSAGYNVGTVELILGLLEELVASGS